MDEPVDIGANAIALVGNPGSGKSTLLNGLVGEKVFEAGISIGGGLTQALRRYEKDEIVFFDTPGLSDAERRKEAGLELDKMLQEELDIKIVFVVTLQHGRVRPDDASTIDLVLSAITCETNGKFGVIINQISRAVRDGLKKNSVAEASVRKKFTGKWNTKYWHYIDFEDSLMDAQNGSNCPEELIMFLRMLPVAKTRETKVISIKTSGTRENLEEQMKRIEELENANQSIKEEMKKEVERHNEEIDNLKHRMRQQEGRQCIVQ